MLFRSITNRFWSFGDNSTTNTSETTVSHTYTSGGTNNIILTVTGPVGVDSYGRTNYVMVIDGLMIKAIRVSGSDVIINFLSSASASYAVEFTDTLTPATWNDAISSIPGNGAIVTATHSGGASGSLRFYRIRQLP